jgi:hypothetical protein
VPNLSALRDTEPKISAYIQRYLRFVRFLFLERTKDTGDLDARLGKYREALAFLRIVAMETFFHLDAAAMQTLLIVLLEIHQQIVLAKSEMYGLFGGQKNGDELVSMLVETMLVAWIRSGTDQPQLWKALHEQMSQKNSTRYVRTVLEWAVSLPIV